MKTEAYAKVNLTLEILGRRDDGYHELRSLVVPVSLSDGLEITEAEGISSDSGFADDLCLKAAYALARRTGCTKGAFIHVEKHVPVGGGLGGGSADAAATLTALDEIWELGLDRQELAEIGAEVGSDVPALVLGGAVLMEGRGEKVSLLDPQPPRLELVLVNPGVFCSTREVYARVDGCLQDRPEILYNITEAFRNGDVGAVASAMMNDLEAGAVALHGEIGEALGSLEAAGALGVMVSGSGSSVFGLVPNEARGREIAAQMEAKGFWARSVHTIVR